MTQEEQLEVDIREVEQLVLHQGWKVVERRLTQAIEGFQDALLVAPFADVERLRQRIIVYKELLKLPTEVMDQFKEMKDREDPA